MLMHNSFQYLITDASRQGHRVAPTMASIRPGLVVAEVTQAVRPQVPRAHTAAVIIPRPIVDVEVAEVLIAHWKLQKKSVLPQKLRVKRHSKVWSRWRPRKLRSSWKSHRLLWRRRVGLALNKHATLSSNRTTSDHQKVWDCHSYIQYILRYKCHRSGSDASHLRSLNSWGLDSDNGTDTGKKKKEEMIK